MTKPNFNKMSRIELRKYILTHREDNEAFQAYMHRLDTDPDVKWISGGCDEEGMKLLESLIEQKIRKSQSE